MNTWALTKYSVEEAVVWRFSAEKVFLKILQYSHENTCAGVSF